jgi:predicted cupin superfamily sugar epimerase
VSRWHRVASDEVWHLYEGGPLEVLSVDPACSTLSRSKLEAHSPVCTVAATNWQAARTLGEYALAGCTVAPGFDFADFSILADDAPTVARLLAAWPDTATFI